MVPIFRDYIRRVEAAGQEPDEALVEGIAEALATLDEDDGEQQNTIGT
jgi:hypothetical protein